MATAIIERDKPKVKLVIYPEIKPDIIESKAGTKHLLIDLDGVVVEYDLPKLVKEYFGVELVAPISAYDLADHFGVTQKEIDKMFEPQVYGPANFIDGSLEILKGWESKGYRMMIYSNRIKYMNEWDLTLWLITYKIPFAGLDIKGTGEYDFHIDDYPKKLASTNSRVKLLYTQPWNLQCENIRNNLTRVKSWEEIKNIVG